MGVLTPVFEGNIVILFTPCTHQIPWLKYPSQKKTNGGPFWPAKNTIGSNRTNCVFGRIKWATNCFLGGWDKRPMKCRAYIILFTTPTQGFKMQHIAIEQPHQLKPIRNANDSNQTNCAFPSINWATNFFFFFPAWIKGLRSAEHILSYLSRRLKGLGCSS